MSSPAKKQRRVHHASNQETSVSTPGIVSTRTPFQMQMDHLKLVEYQRLNEEGTKMLQYLRTTSNPTVLLRRGLNEYLRSAELIDLAYDSTKTYCGKVIGMGSNESSQLLPKNITDDDDDGDDNKPNSNLLPTTNSLLKVDIRAVSAGGIHSLALSTNGVPYSWGASDDGALGRIIRGSTNANVDLEGQPEPVTGFYTTTSPNQQSNRVCEDGKIIKIAACESHSLFLSVYGNVYQCGSYVSDGKKFSVVSEKVIDGTTTTKKTVFGANPLPVHVNQLPGKAVAIFAGAESSAALLEDHTLVTWGKLFFVFEHV